MRHAVFALVLVGCGPKPAPEPAKKPAPPPTGTAADTARGPCVAAIGKAAATGRGDETFTEEEQKLGAQIEGAMADSCVATSWGPHVLACLSNGISREELQICTEVMTPVQREDMMERLLVVTKAHEAANAPTH